MSVAKINPENAASFTPREALEMALEDVMSGAIDPQKIYIITEHDYYCAGIKNNYEALGMLSVEMDDIHRRCRD